MTDASDEPPDFEPIELCKQDVDPSVLSSLTGAQAHRIRAVPLRRDGDRLVVAADEPAELIERALELLTGCAIDLRRAPARAIEKALARHYPDPAYPETTEAEARLRGVLRHGELIGFEVVYGNVGSAILARCDRVRVRRPWRVAIGRRDGGGASEVIEVDETADGEALFTGQHDMLDGLGASFRRLGERVYHVPLRFFGDRIYEVAVDVRKDEILLDINPPPA